jgi:lysylphosphatidylglycerol synthetase-like protein (DUF2156 family)
MKAAQGARRAVAALAVITGVADLVVATGANHIPTRGLFLPIRLLVDALAGSRFVLLTAGLVLAMTVRGLLHGRRNAWRLAVVAVLASLVGTSGAGTLLVAGGAVVMLSARRFFPAGSDPALVRRGWRLLVVGVSVTLGYAAVGLAVVADGVLPSTTGLGSARDGLRLLVLVPMDTAGPVPGPAWFIGSARLAALVVVLTATAQLLATLRRPAGHDDRAIVEELLATWATTPLAHFHLLNDNAWLVAEDRRSFIGYKLVGTTAIALGDAVGEPESCRRVVAEFVDRCQRNGWTPAMHQVGPDRDGALAEAGLKLLKIGEEAILDVQRWDEGAKGHKHLRSALRRVERAGLEAVELPQPIDEATMAELRSVSDAWMSDGGHRERTFTLGQFDPDYLRATTVLAVRDGSSGRIVAFANVLPAYRSEAGNFDLMRRLPDAPNGVMEYLFVAMIKRFQADGRTGMHLGLAPMANIDGDGVAERALRSLYRLEEAFNCQGLFRFKDKWKPTWEPRYLAYRSETELPKVAAAVMRAGELPDAARWRGRFAAVARRMPFTIAVQSLLLGLLVASALNGLVQPELLVRSGLGWSDVVHRLGWWLLGSQLLQTTPDLVLVNLTVGLVALPLAECRLGTRRAAAFWACDWLAGLTLLGVAPLVPSVASFDSLHLVTSPDGGPSAAVWALILAAALTVSDTRARRTATAAGLAFLIGVAVFRQDFADLHRLLAAVLAVAGAVMASRLLPARRPGFTGLRGWATRAALVEAGAEPVAGTRS